MSKDLFQADQAIANALDNLNGLEALILLLDSAREADMPSGRALAELIEPIQKSIVLNLQEAQRNLHGTR